MLLFSSLSYAQKSCLNTLREAKDLYEQGLIDEIPGLLADCMESGFTRAQRIEAYKLIILAYLFDDDQFAAEKMMDEFLRKFPEYEVMPNDPVEFVYLLESYKTSSFYSVNLTFGPTFTNPVIQEQFSTQDVTNTEYKNTTGTGFHIGLGVSRNLFKSINGNIGFFYSTYNYSFLETTRFQVSEEDFTETENLAEERLTRIDIPLTVTYIIGKGNLHYFARLGGSVGIVTNVDLSLSRSHSELDNSISNPDIDFSNYRRSMDYAIVIGGGFEYKIPRGYLVLDLRYKLGLSDITLSEKRHDDPLLYSRYFHLDDDFTLNNFTVAVGYHFSIYQSKKNRF